MKTLTRTESSVRPTPKLLNDIAGDASRRAIFDEAFEADVLTMVASQQMVCPKKVRAPDATAELYKFAATFEQPTDCLVEALDENGKVEFWLLILWFDSEVDNYWV